MLFYLFVTAAWFAYMLTDAEIWEPLDPAGKRLFVSAVVSPFWPILITVLILRKIVNILR
jgi:hypothetical protein